jgi:hypothetical protein
MEHFEKRWVILVSLGPLGARRNMPQRWDGTWTDKRQHLARAVFAATKRQAPYAPMEGPVSVGSPLMRAVGRNIIKVSGTGTINASSANNAIQIRDATSNKNRFTGAIPSCVGQPALIDRRGGLYCSNDATALAAEMYHYSGLDFSRKLLGYGARYSVFEHKWFAKLQVVRDITVVNLGSKSERTLPFLEKLQADNNVNRALKDLGYKELFQALTAEDDYSATRGLGLGLASIPTIDGAQVLSARDYNTPVGDNFAYQTGDNVVLFGLNQRSPLDLVRVESLHRVHKDAAGDLKITHFEIGSTGNFEVASIDSLVT